MKPWRPARDEALGWTLLVVALGPALARVVGAWSDPIAEHGPLVVAACAWLVWRSRGRLATTPSVPRPWLGATVMALALWIGDAAALEPHVTITGPAALLAVAGHLVARHGLGVLRVVWFPLAFGLFALPAPGPAMFSLSVRLKVLAAALAERLLDGAGLAVVRVGATLHVPSGALLVDDACSGLRGLVAIVAFAALMAYLVEDRRRGALALLLSVPLAVVANVARIVVMVLLASQGHTWALEGAAHQATGLAVYAVALVAVLGISGRVATAPPAAPPQGQPPADRPAPGAVARGLLLALVVVFAGLSLPMLRPTRSDVAARLPERLGRFTGAVVPLEPRVFEVLGDDVAARRYVVDDPSAPVDVIVVHAVDDPWRAQHPPDNCFVIGGWDVVEARDVTLPTGRRAWRRLFRLGERAELVYYWIQVGEREVTDPLSLRLEMFSRRLRGDRRAGATLIRLSTPVDRRPVEHADRRIMAFAAEGLAPLDRALRDPVIDSGR